MKQVLKCILFLVIIAGGFLIYFKIGDIKKNKLYEEIKNAWYVEITLDKINVRKDHYEDEEAIGKVKKGEIYKVLDIDTTSSSIYFWYKIDYKGEEGWIASGRKNHWLEDHNNPNDIQTPEIKFESNLYQVRSIDDINYKHLEVIEDSDDYEITHTVYHEIDLERFIDQYWILYTITDASGKSSSKMQKIEFEITPDEDRVEDFANYR